MTDPRDRDTLPPETLMDLHPTAEEEETNPGLSPPPKDPYLDHIPRDAPKWFRSFTSGMAEIKASQTLTNEYLRKVEGEIFSRLSGHDREIRELKDDLQLMRVHSQQMQEDIERMNAKIEKLKDARQTQTPA